jgi:hypothetical protein
MDHGMEISNDNASTYLSTSTYCTLASGYLWPFLPTFKRSLNEGISSYLLRPERENGDAKVHNALIELP